MLYNLNFDKYIITCIHHYSSITALKILGALPIHPFLPPQLLATADFLSVSIVLPFLEGHSVGIINMQAFQTGFLHLVIGI